MKSVFVSVGETPAHICGTLCLFSLPSSLSRACALSLSLSLVCVCVCLQSICNDAYSCRYFLLVRSLSASFVGAPLQVDLEREGGEGVSV